MSTSERRAYSIECERECFVRTDDESYELSQQSHISCKTVKENQQLNRKRPVARPMKFFPQQLRLKTNLFWQTSVATPFLGCPEKQHDYWVDQTSTCITSHCIALSYILCIALHNIGCHIIIRSSWYETIWNTNKRIRQTCRAGDRDTRNASSSCTTRKQSTCRRAYRRQCNRCPQKPGKWTSLNFYN